MHTTVVIKLIWLAFSLIELYKNSYEFKTCIKNYPLNSLLINVVTICCFGSILFAVFSLIIFCSHQNLFLSHDIAFNTLPLFWGRNYSPTEFSFLYISIKFPILSYRNCLESWDKKHWNWIGSRFSHTFMLTPN